MSAAQFALFQQPGAARKPGQPRLKRRPEDLPENQLTRQVCDFLRAKGWTVTRQQSGLFCRPFDPASRIRIGEPGCSDWRAERPVIPTGARRGSLAQYHQLFYFELKAPGKKPRPDQLAWLRAREATGTLARWFDAFNGGRSSDFVAWYRATFEQGETSATHRSPDGGG